MQIQICLHEPEKNKSPFQKKFWAETVHCIPKGLHKGNPFHGPFAQLSYGWIDAWMHGCTDAWIDERMHEYMGAWVDRWIIDAVSYTNIQNYVYKDFFTILNLQLVLDNMLSVFKNAVEWNLSKYK